MASEFDLIGTQAKEEGEDTEKEYWEDLRTRLHTASAEAVQELDEEEQRLNKLRFSYTKQREWRYDPAGSLAGEFINWEPGTVEPGPGVGGAFMQGVTFRREDLFGEWGGGLEPQSIGEHGASFVGSMVPLMASFLATRYPLAAAFAGEQAAGLLLRIAVEVGAGLFTDVGVTLLEGDLEKEDAFLIIGLGAVAGALLPGPLAGLGKASKLTSKRALSEVVSLSEKRIAVAAERGVVVSEPMVKEAVETALESDLKAVETNDLLPSILTARKMESSVGKKAVGKYDTHGESVVGTFNDLTEAYRTRKDTLADEATRGLEAFRQQLPDETMGVGVRKINEVFDTHFNYTGGLDPHEYHLVQQELDKVEWRWFDPDVLREELRVRNQRAFLHGVPSERFHTRVGETIVSPTDDTALILGTGRHHSGVKEYTDDLIAELRLIDDNMADGLKPYTTVKGRELYWTKLQEAAHKLNTLDDDKELALLRKDLDTVVNHMKDPNLEFGVPRGFHRSPEVKRLAENLLTAAEIYQHRPDILEQQLKDLANLAVKKDAGLEREYTKTLRILSEYQAQAEEKQVNAVLQAIKEGDEFPEINSANVYTKSKAALKEQLKSTPEFEQYINLQFVAGDEARTVMQQMDVALDQRANQLLGGTWDEIQPVLDDNIGNPTRLRENVIKTRAALGDTQAQEYAKFEATQKRDVSFTGIAHSGDPIDAHVAPGGGKGEAPRLSETPERVTLEGADTSVTPEVAIDRRDLGHNPASKFLGELKTNIGVFKRKLVATGDTKGADILNRVELTLDDFTQTHRTYLDMTANFNDRRNTMTAAWRQQGIYDDVLHHVDEISALVNKKIREAADTPREQLEGLITEYLAKQSTEVRAAYREAEAFETEKYQLLYDFITDFNERYGTNIARPRFRPGHVHFVYDGDWLFHVKTPDGVGFKIPMTSKTDLSMALNDLVEQGHNMDDVVFKMTPRWAEALEDFTIADSALKDGSAFGINMQEIKKMYESHGKFRSETVMDVVFGGIEHRTMGLESRKKAVADAWAISDRLTARYIHMMEASVKLEQAVTTLEKAEFHTLSKQVRQWGNDVLGKSRNFEQDIDSHLGFIHDVIDKVPGLRYGADAAGLRRGARPLRAGIGMLASVSRLLSIGFNPMTALIQLTQGLTNVAPVLGARNFYRGWHHIKDFMVTGSRLNKLATRAGIFVRGIDDMSSSGWGLQRKIMKPRMAQSNLEYGMDMVEHYSMMPFNAVENRQRLASLYAGILDGEQKAKQILAGKKGKEAGYQILEDIAKPLGKAVDDQEVIDRYAIKMLEKLQFDFDTTGVTALARNPLFKLPMQFKTYFFQEMEFLMGRKLPLTPAERFKSLAVFLGLGGVAGLPFAEDIDTVATKIFGKSPMLWLYANAPDIITAGFPGLVNLNLSPLIQAGGTRSLGLLPGFGGILSTKLWRAYQEYSNGRADGLKAILGTNTMARNFMEAYDMWKYGGVYAPGGTTLLREGGMLDVGFEALGVQSLTNSKVQKLEMELYKTQKSINAQRRIDKERIVTSTNPYEKGKELGYERKLIKQWVEERKRGKMRSDTLPKATKEEYDDYIEKIRPQGG